MSIRLNAPRVKYRGIRGRFAREVDYAALIALADTVDELEQGRGNLVRVMAALQEVKRGRVQDYPSVIAKKAERAAERLAL